MDLLDQGARIGAAGFVLSRLLLEAPSQALAENFAAPQMRATWPLQDPLSTTALEAVAADPYETLPRDHATLFRRHPGLVPLHESTWRSDVTDAPALRGRLAAEYRAAGLPVPADVDDHLGHQVAYLADLATRIGRAWGQHDAASARVAADAASRFRREHTDLVVEPILQAIEQHARTHLYRAVPDLLRGFLTAHAALCAAVVPHSE
ncbi:TorD/DmsD family molecular chaperone [Georgenia sp. H159]|uniref:TorD/DmsD family molecular chaperone n=1 Tax=Georgenia sp. H159 TaxID=3076115 RepID=UPI002D76643D|nr:molecular chaperone TorD family protein [Georgenia sp. H159]